MFLIDNAVPFRNGVLIQGHFTQSGVKLLPGETCLAEKNGVRVGIVRFMGILNANFSHNPCNPRYHISVGFEGDCRNLIGCTLSLLKTSA